MFKDVGDMLEMLYLCHKIVALDSITHCPLGLIIQNDMKKKRLWMFVIVALAIMATAAAALVRWKQLFILLLTPAALYTET